MAKLATFLLQILPRRNQDRLIKHKDQYETKTETSFRGQEYNLKRSGINSFQCFP